MELNFGLVDLNQEQPVYVSEHQSIRDKHIQPLIMYKNGMKENTRPLTNPQFGEPGKTNAKDFTSKWLARTMRDVSAVTSQQRARNLTRQGIESRSRARMCTVKQRSAESMVLSGNSSVEVLLDLGPGSRETLTFGDIFGPFLQLFTKV